MNNYPSFHKLILPLLILVSITIQPVLAQKRDEKKSGKANRVKELIDQKKYSFKPTYMLPSGGTSVYLTSEYSVDVSGDTVTCYLPFFGRAYSAPMNANDSGINFKSTDVQYDEQQPKNDRWDITLKPNDKSNGVKLTMRVFDNGSASLNVVSNDKEPISFQGTITENSTAVAYPTTRRK